MVYSKMAGTDWKYQQSQKNSSGEIIVSHSPYHTLYWEEYGNPQGEPIIFIHGGPGGACSEEYSRFFAPDRYRIILYDQRGCGKSTPHISINREAGMAGNITANLVDDIEKLRADRKITRKVHIFGGSWGSTLALAYAEAYPENVQNLILRGIFLCDKNDLDFFYQGNAETYATNPDDTSLQGAYRAYISKAEYTIPPTLHDAAMAEAYKKAWHDYVTIIPPEERHDMIAAYHKRLNASEFSSEQKLEAALAWSTWEGVTSYLCHDVSDLGKFRDHKFAVAFATIENEYFYRALRGADPAISGLIKPENLDKLAQIPIYIVQGKYDQVCVPASAHSLKTALEKAGAKHLYYKETIAGHSMMDMETNEELTRIMDNLPIISYI